MAGYFSKARLFRWHAALGVCCGGLLFVVCFGGTVAVFSDEIDWLLRPHLHVEDTSGPMNWEAARQSLEEEFPDYQLVSLVAPPHAGFPVRAYARTAGGTYVNLYADPATGEVLGGESYWNVQRFLRSFHRRFFLPQPYGVLTLSLFAVFLGVLVVTGLRTLGSKWRNFFHRVRWRAGPKAVLADCHRLFGIWSWLLAAVLVLTGIWYGVEMAAPARPEGNLPRLPGGTGGERPAVLESAGLGEQAKAAEAAIDGFRAERIYPGGPDRPVVVMGYAGPGRLVRPRANLAALDPVSGEVLGTRLSSEADLHTWVSEMADPLHFGTWSGLLSQSIWFVLGLALSAAIPVGMVLAFKRIPNKRMPGPAVLWGSAAVSAGLIGYSIYGGVAEYDYWTRESERFVLLGETGLGPWQAHLYRGFEDGSPTANFRLRLRTSGAGGSENRANFRELRLRASAEGEDGAGAEAAEFTWGGGISAQRFPSAILPDNNGGMEADPENWLVRAELPEGGRVEARFPGEPPADPEERASLAGPPPTVPAVHAFVALFSAVVLGVLAVVYWFLARLSHRAVHGF